MSEPTPSQLDPTAVADFHDSLKKANRIVAVIGAGISVASGLTTFRGTNGLWKNQDVFSVASPAGFRHDPGLVWQFYTYRRHEALRAEPNTAHYALAELARRLPGFVALTQNVDNLSPRAGHPPDQLKQLHGNLFTLRCTDELCCGYVEHDNFEVSLTPALDPSKDEAEMIGRIDSGAIPKASPLLLAGLAKKNSRILGDKYQDSAPTSEDVAALRSTDNEGKHPSSSTRSDVRLTSGIKTEDLPQCPKCKNNILRPGVVWFGEGLPLDIVLQVEALLEDPEPIDIFLTLGTSSSVWPAAGYAEAAAKKGARVAVVNTDPSDAKGIRPGRDWVFVGDAAVILPELLKPIIGGRHEWANQATAAPSENLMPSSRQDDSPNEQ
ncbi:DHS-like NAD/FAD-binding domain-containing protein [Plectosphaerella cucumerina]|uniref:DHS-like NAD/FAD-binding domain-containing protein n=1 Tax=Plectosphaerella cucumerina TaxID=40658 RepID=A0A8K0X0K7_9PEZI|nr:DHS-like NAD/FAD-binding domain-containing protein [Plectosphaerella cucumerina]